MRGKVSPHTCSHNLQHAPALSYKEQVTLSFSNTQQKSCAFLLAPGRHTKVLRSQQHHVQPCAMHGKKTSAFEDRQQKKACTAHRALEPLRKREIQSRALLLSPRRSTSCTSTPHKAKTSLWRESAAHTTPLSCAQTSQPALLPLCAPGDSHITLVGRACAKLETG